MAQVSLFNVKQHLLPTIQNIVGNYEEPDENSIIWQQMPLKHFNSLLTNKQLCFKQLSQYTEADERKLKYYKECYLTEDIKKNEIILKLIENFEKIIYVSCWFQQKTLANLAFREYASEEGIAIGLTIHTLLDALQNSKDILSDEEIYGGKVIYLDGTHKNVVTNQEVIAPLFLKSTGNEADHEFRVICIKDSLWQSDINGLHLPPDIDEKRKTLFLNTGETADFIKYIATKKEITEVPLLCEILDLHNLKAKESIITMDDFKVYEIERI